MINFSPFFLSSNDKKRFQLVLTVWKKESIVVWWHKVPYVRVLSEPVTPYHPLPLDIPDLSGKGFTTNSSLVYAMPYGPPSNGRQNYGISCPPRHSGRFPATVSMFLIWRRISVRHIDSAVTVVFKYSEALTSVGESSLCSCIFWSCRSYLLRPSLLSPSTHIAVSPPSASIAGTVMRTHEKMHIPHRCYLITYTTKHYPVPVFSFLFVVVFSLFWLRKKCTHVFNESPKNIL